jgi:hypothetical protein
MSTSLLLQPTLQVIAPQPPRLLDQVARVPLAPGQAKGCLAFPPLLTTGCRSSRMTRGSGNGP